MECGNAEFKKISYSFPKLILTLAHKVCSIPNCGIDYPVYTPLIVNTSFNMLLKFSFHFLTNRFQALS